MIWAHKMSFNEGMSTILSCLGPLNTLMYYYCLYLLFTILNAKLNAIVPIVMRLIQSRVSRIHFEFLYRNSYLLSVIEVSSLSMTSRSLGVLLILVLKMKSLDLSVDISYSPLMVYKLWK